MGKKMRGGGGGGRPSKNRSSGSASVSASAAEGQAEQQQEKEEPKQESRRDEGGVGGSEVDDGSAAATTAAVTVVDASDDVTVRSGNGKSGGSRGGGEGGGEPSAAASAAAIEGGTADEAAAGDAPAEKTFTAENGPAEPPGDVAGRAEDETRADATVTTTAEASAADANPLRASSGDDDATAAEDVEDADHAVSTGDNDGAETDAADAEADVEANAEAASHLTEAELVGRARKSSTSPLQATPSSESPCRLSSTFASRSSLRESFFSGSNASRSGTDDELEAAEPLGDDGGRLSANRRPDLPTVLSLEEGQDAERAPASDTPVLFESETASSVTSAEMVSAPLTDAARTWVGESSLLDVPHLLSEIEGCGPAVGGGEDTADGKQHAADGNTGAATTLFRAAATVASPDFPARSTTAEALEAAEIRAAAVQIEGGAGSAAASGAAGLVASSELPEQAASSFSFSPPPKPLCLPLYKETSDSTHGTSVPSKLDVAIPADLARDVTLGHSNVAATVAEAVPSVQPQQQPQRQPALQKKTSVSEIAAEAPASRSEPPPLSTAGAAAPGVEVEVDEDNRIRLGICAMDKKARSKPMGEILSRLDEALFEVVFFGDDMILNEPVEEWPVVNVLIAFYSSGYPLEKAERYADLRRPFLLNDLPMQRVLKDRRRVYDLLEASGIDVPRHIYMSRDGYISRGSGAGNRCNDPESELEEHDDHIEINGVTIHKPFVEKPVDADDHNIAIYYPTSAGGGCKKLFRKVGDRSSEFYPDINEVRRDGSYIYEEFVETQGTDVKMYTVGPDYGHAEARKSPTVDGKVERNSDGKEVRFPVILTLREKEIARRIVLVFRQQVCGFDLLRVQEGDSLVSFVCDVNGWSFVKNSRKYYDDCAQILTEHMLAAVKPNALRCFSALDPMLTTQRDDDEHEVAREDMSSARTGDVTPKKQRKKRKVGQKTSNALQRVSRMLQGVGGAEEQEGTGVVLTPTRQAPVPMAENTSGFVDPPPPGAGAPLVPSLVVETAAATLEEGAAPVRDIPHQLATEPPSMTASASSSVVGNDDASAGTAEASSRISPAGGTANSAQDEKRGSQMSEKGGTHQEELRCVIAVIRHGDRTPKQKLKVCMSEPGVLRYFHNHNENCRKDLKVKAKKPMEEFLETVKHMIAEKERERAEAMKLMVIQEISAGSGDGVVDREEAKRRNKAARRAARTRMTSEDRDLLYKLQHMRDVLQRWKIGGLNRKLQIKPRAWEEVVVNDDSGEKAIRCTEVQLILKWGGNLTKLGERQSIHLGQRMRHELYPDAPGGGILRLHSTFRHDLKIKTSDEGRVMKTAAAFAKGMLELEGEIPPILVSLVHKEKNSHHMLDPSGNKEVKKELEVCKEKINDHLQRDFDFGNTTEAEHEEIVGPHCLKSLHNALREVENPRKTLFAIHKMIGELLEQLDEMLDQMASEDENRNEGGEGLRCDAGSNEEALSGIKLYKGETLLELTERWRLLHRRLYDEEQDLFDLSRVPDVHDNVRFDMLHNPHLGLTETLEKLYNLAKVMADCAVPQEYGTTIAEKRSIGVKMCRALLEKIKYDLIIARTDNEVDMRYMINMDYSADLNINTMGRRIRTRLYFTSESHLHTLLNVLRFRSAKSECCDRGPLLSKRGMDIANSTPELCYLTQIFIRLFEDPMRAADDPRRFRVEILLSPGATATPLHMAEMDRDSDASRFETTPAEMISKDGLTCQEVESYFTEVIREGETEEDVEDLVSVSTGNVKKKNKKKKAENIVEEKKVEENKTTTQAEEKEKPVDLPPVACNTPMRGMCVADSTARELTDGSGAVDSCGESAPTVVSAVEYPPDYSQTSNKKDTEDVPNNSRSLDFSGRKHSGGNSAGKIVSTEAKVVASRSGIREEEASDDEKLQRLERMLARRYFWTSVAVVSFTIGMGCLAVAFGSRRRSGPTRRWTKR